MNLGECLAWQRKKHNFTQLELSDRLNISQQVISNYERNITSPPIDFLQLLADFYSISVDELIGRRVFKTENNIEKQILDIIVNLDETEKELSFVIISALSQYRGKKDDK